MARGLLWRFALVGAATLGALISPAVPLAVAMGVLVGGQIIALRDGPGAAAPLWRTGLIALALSVGLAASPKVVVAGLAWVGVEPWIRAGQPWRSTLRGLGARMPGRSEPRHEWRGSVPLGLEPRPGEEGWR